MRNKNFFTGIGIIAIGLIVAGGIFIARYEKAQEETEFFLPERELVEITPISDKDHILGNPNAKVIVMEFSHFECPFTQQFHQTMKRIMAEYGQLGQVAWVVRHIPVPDLYPNSYKAAVASECIADLGKKAGNRAAFWDFMDITFGNVPARLDTESFRKTAESLEIDPDEFEACLITDKFKAKIDGDAADAYRLFEIDPNFVTPYNLIFSTTGLQTRVPGSASYEELREIIELMLNQ